MKNIINKSFLAIGSVLLLVGCNENSWNNDLEGFEIPNQYNNKETLNITLTTADYVKVAGEARNVELAAAAGQEDALKAIGSNGYFSSAEEARLYLPAFLRDSTLNYYAMDEGSSVNVTYDLIENLPEIVKSVNAGVDTYTLTAEDYQQAWGSDDDFISGFAPMKPAADALPAILKEQFPDAQAGQYAVVSYNQSDVNPVFGSVGGGGDEPVATWEATSVLTNDIDIEDELTVNGWVAAIDNRGFVLADKAGAILFYIPSGFDPASVAIGDKIIASGAVSAYGTAYQLATDNGATWENVGADPDFAQPTVEAYDGAAVTTAAARTGNALAKYVSITGSAVVSGNYINIHVDGADADVTQGSGYQLTTEQKGWFEDGKKYQITGYFVSVSTNSSTGVKYFNMVPVDVKDAAGKPAMRNARRAPASQVATYVQNAIYEYDGSKWAVPANATILQPADYTAMGQTYGNLSGSGDTQYLPTFLAKQYPYALEDDVMTVVYQYYDGSSTAPRATQFILTAGVWIKNGGAATDKFTKRDGFWNYNPSVEITLPYSRNTDPSYSYYMHCCDWVLENVVKPTQPDATLTTSEYYIDYRGNAEFYSGASAYYGNVDIRATSAINNAPEGTYEGMSNDQIMNLMKERFTTQTLPYAVAKMNPQAVPVEGMDITYTVTFTAYTGAAEEHTIVYRVVAPGEFEYVSSTWGEGIDADWKVDF